MRLADDALPALVHLVGPDAADVLRPPVEAAGDRIVAARAVGVQYRPGSDVVVRYSVSVADATGATRTDTIVAASTVHGEYPGAVVVEADAPGGPLTAAVWKWPFDPFVAGIAAAATPTLVAELLGVGPAEQVRPAVVAYRPTERLVVRVEHPPVSDASGAQVTTSYVKAVRPSAADAVAGRHVTMIGAGVPAAPVRRVDSDQGVLVLDELAGPTVREMIKQRRVDELPAPERYDDLADALASVVLDPDVPPAPRLLVDGALHAEMLATVHPHRADALNDLALGFRSAADDEVRSGGPSVTAHGDLHEAQIVVGAGGVVTGLLDVDDAGPGRPIDDRANLVARLRYRAALDRRVGDVADAYGDRIRDASVARHDAAELDLRTAAALIGLATGPFRAQTDRWRDDVDRLVDVAEQLAGRAGRPRSWLDPR